MLSPAPMNQRKYVYNLPLAALIRYVYRIWLLCSPVQAVDAEPMYRSLPGVSDPVMRHKGRSRAIPIVDPVSGEALSFTPHSASVVEALHESADTGPSFSTSSGSQGPIGPVCPSMFHIPCIVCSDSFLVVVCGTLLRKGRCVVCTAGVRVG